MNSKRSRDVIEMGPHIYGVTINLSPYKKVDGKKWSLYEYLEQCEILRDLWCNEQMDVIGSVSDDYIFEHTGKGNAHMHAMVTCTERELKAIRAHINEKHKYPRDREDMIFHYSRTLIHRVFWDKYRRKEKQNDPEYIPEYNMMTAEVTT